MKYIVTYDLKQPYLTLVCADISNGLAFNFASEMDKKLVLDAVYLIVNGKEKHTDDIERRNNALIKGVVVDGIVIKYSHDAKEQVAYFKTEDDLDADTLPILPPIGQFILDNIPIEKRVITPNGAYFHYSDVCNLLKKYKNYEG